MHEIDDDNDFIQTNEEIAEDLKVEIQALGINLENQLKNISCILFGIFIISITALIHFW